MKMPKRQAAAPEAPPIERAVGQYKKAHDAQLAAEAALQEANEKVSTQAAEVIKARWKPVISKAYQSALTRSRVFFRDRFYAPSTRIAQKREIEDMMARRRPAGARNYLFRFAIKQAQAPVQDMLVLECALEPATTPNEATSTMWMEYRGQRMLFNKVSTLRAFATYLMAEEGAAALSKDALRTLCNDTLFHLTHLMVDYAQYLNKHYFPPNSFYMDYNGFFNWVCGHIMLLPVAGTFEDENGPDSSDEEQPEEEDMGSE
jgi:hypothetical protein